MKYGTRDLWMLSMGYGDAHYFCCSFYVVGEDSWLFFSSQRCEFFLLFSKSTKLMTNLTASPGLLSYRSAFSWRLPVSLTLFIGYFANIFQIQSTLAVMKNYPAVLSQSETKKYFE